MYADPLDPSEEDLCVWLPEEERVPLQDVPHHHPPPHGPRPPQAMQMDELAEAAAHDNARQNGGERMYRGGSDFGIRQSPYTYVYKALSSCSNTLAW